MKGIRYWQLIVRGQIGSAAGLSCCLQLAEHRSVWCMSVTALVWILYFGITNSSLRLGIYDLNKNFHRILQSEQVSNKSAMFVLIN